MKRTEGKELSVAVESFTLGEAVAVHSALLQAKSTMERDSKRIIKDHGRDVYDSIWRDVGTALEKITRMAKELRQLQGENDGA